MTDYEVAQFLSDDLTRELGGEFPASMVSTMRIIALDAFMGTMQGMDRGRSAKQDEPDAAAAQAYHRAWSKNHDDEYISGMPKPPAQHAGGNAFDMSYDGGGNLSSAKGAGYTFEIQRDSAGKMMRVVAKPQ